MGTLRSLSVFLGKAPALPPFPPLLPGVVAMFRTLVTASIGAVGMLSLVYLFASVPDPIQWASPERVGVRDLIDRPGEYDGRVVVVPTEGFRSVPGQPRELGFHKFDSHPPAVVIRFAP